MSDELTQAYARIIDLETQVAQLESWKQEALPLLQTFGAEIQAELERRKLPQNNDDALSLYNDLRRAALFLLAAWESEDQRVLMNALVALRSAALGEPNHKQEATGDESAPAMPT